LDLVLTTTQNRKRQNVRLSLSYLINHLAKATFEETLLQQLSTISTNALEQFFLVAASESSLARHHFASIDCFEACPIL